MPQCSLRVQCAEWTVFQTIAPSQIVYIYVPNTLTPLAPTVSIFTESDDFFECRSNSYRITNCFDNKAVPFGALRVVNPAHTLIFPLLMAPSRLTMPTAWRQNLNRADFITRPSEFSYSSCLVFPVTTPSASLVSRRESPSRQCDLRRDAELRRPETVSL